MCVRGVKMKKKGMKRIQVTFTNEQWKLIEKLKGEMGVTDSEVVRNIVMAWLVEKSFISSTLKLKIFRKGKEDDGG